MLRENQIRLYNRLAFARELMLIERDRWNEQSSLFEAFQKRYVDTSGSAFLNGIVEAPDVKALSKPELEEYLALVAALIERTDVLRGRMDLLDLEIRSLLLGETNESALLDAAVKVRPEGFGVAMRPPGNR